MGLAEDLLEQSQKLLYLDKTRPKQATLRRAISTTYYAVFHLLTDEGARLVVSGSGRRPLRNAVRRAFAHTRMADAAKAFNRGQHKLSGLLSTKPAPELRKIADAFVDLQEARHTADYDVAKAITRADADDAIKLARDVFVDWEKIRATDDARVILVALLLWKDLRD